MSTSAEATRQERKQVPVYKRRRRRIYGSVAVAAIVVIAFIVWVVTQNSSSTPIPSFTVAYGQGTVANSDSIIASDPLTCADVVSEVGLEPFAYVLGAAADLWLPL